MKVLNKQSMGTLLGFAGLSLFTMQMFVRVQWGRRITLTLYEVWEALFFGLSFDELPDWAVRLMEMIPLPGLLVALGYFLVAMHREK